jgi:acyl-CoA reductase-like NAD-dependent aldehyde dehydrogenase
MLKVVNPATEEVIGELEEDSAESVVSKFKEAACAQKAWARRPVQERMECLRRFNGLLQERRGELAEVLTSEVGKPVKQAAGEISAVGARVEFFIEHIESVLEPRVIVEDAAGGMTEKVSFAPLGVVGNISAWNFPYFVGANVFVPALLAGNAVLYKPSEFATLTGLAIADLLYEAGVPKEVFAVLVGGGEVGKVLLEQPLGGMFFTGSHATGVKIAEAASRKMMRLQLELGGKDPAYIADDVDVASVAAGVADGAFYNAGQSCCSVERIYIHQSIYEEFVEHFVSTVKGFRMGDPMHETTYLGPLTRAPQLQVLEAQVADACSKGARLLAGGKAAQGPGNYFEPTVLADATDAMEVMREESFGPIIGLQKVSDDAEALACMNDSRYGLTASVFTASRERAEAMLQELEAGSAYWNCCDRVSPNLPWTGWKDSGVGSTLGLEGIRAFVQPKAWHLRG